MPNNKLVKQQVSDRSQTTASYILTHQEKASLKQTQNVITFELREIIVGYYVNFVSFIYRELHHKFKKTKKTGSKTGSYLSDCVLRKGLSTLCESLWSMTIAVK